MLVSPGPPPVVAICGKIDIQSAPELREELLLVIRRRGPKVVIDLGGVTVIDCAGLGVLVATRRRAQLEGGWVRLVRVPPQVRQMISLLNLDQAFGLGLSGPAALASIRCWTSRSGTSPRPLPAQTAESGEIPVAKVIAFHAHG